MPGRQDMPTTLSGRSKMTRDEPVDAVPKANARSTRKTGEK